MDLRAFTDDPTVWERLDSAQQDVLDAQFESYYDPSRGIDNRRRAQDLQAQLRNLQAKVASVERRLINLRVDDLNRPGEPAHVYRERYLAVLELRAKGYGDRLIADHLGKERTWAARVIRNGRARFPDIDAPKKPSRPPAPIARYRTPPKA